MAFRRAFAAAAAALTLALAGLTPAYAQDKSREEMKLKKPELVQFKVSL